MKKLAIVLVLGILAACSPGPNATQLEQLIENHLRGQIQARIDAAGDVAGAIGEGLASAVMAKPESIDVWDVAIDSKEKTDTGDVIITASFDYRDNILEPRRESARMTVTKLDGAYRIRQWEWLNRGP